MNKKQTRRISAAKLRGLFEQLTDDICSGRDRVTVALFNNTFVIHLEGGTVNISICQEGGAL